MEIITSALEVLKGWKLLKLIETLTRALDVQSVNPILKTSLCWCSAKIKEKSSELIGLEVKIEEPGNDEDETC